MMDLPHREILAPGPVAARVRELAADCSVAALDGRALDIGDLPGLVDLRSLWISRVSAKAAPRLGEVVQLRRLVIHEYRATDLEPLAGLGELESLAIVGSPPLRSLAGLGSLGSLRELLLLFNCNFSALDPIGSLEALQTLCLEGGFSKPLRVDTLQPLAGLRALERLRLASIRVAEGGLRPLHGLHALRDAFIAATFGETELRRLASALPAAKGQFLDEWR